MRIYDKFLEIAQQYPDHPCITDTQTCTYREMVEKIHSKDNLARFKDACAILYLPKSSDIVVWQLALNASGVAFLTLEYGQDARLLSAIESCQPCLVITSEQVVEYTDYKIYPECAYIVFSSGSTGMPKKILLKDNIAAVVLEQARLTQMNHNQISLWLLNPAFDASLSDIYMTILVGGHLIITDKKPSDIKSLVPIINQHRVTHTDIPPVVFALWLKHIEQMPSLKHVVFGGEKADENKVQSLLKHCMLYNAYGPSETTICSSLCVVTPHWKPEHIGLALGGVEYKIVENELHIAGYCAIGYDNERLDKKFYHIGSKKWFMSGDLVEFDKHADSYVYLGRKDRQFKHNGQLICPEEIESAALKSGASMARVSYQDKILLKYTGALDREQLKDYLPSWMLPHKYEKTELSLNSNWKVTG